MQHFNTLACMSSILVQSCFLRCRCRCRCCCRWQSHLHLLCSSDYNGKTAYFVKWAATNSNKIENLPAFCGGVRQNRNLTVELLASWLFAVRRNEMPQAKRAIKGILHKKRSNVLTKWLCNFARVAIWASIQSKCVYEFHLNIKGVKWIQLFIFLHLIQLCLRSRLTKQKNKKY